MVTLRIALRYLLSKKSHGAVNIISVISMAGVAVATVAIVCVLSVFNGFSDLAGSRLSVIDPELKVIPAQGKVISNADSLAAAVGAVKGVENAVPTITEQALAISGGRQMAVTMRGVPHNYLAVTPVQTALIDGRFDLMADSTPMGVLSVGTAIRLAVRPESEAPLALYVPRRTGRVNPSNPMSAFRSDSIGVAGVYEIDESEKDESTLIIPLATARKLLEFDRQASAIEISAVQGNDLAKVQAAVQAVCGDAYRVLDRMQQEEQSFRMIAIEKWITFIMLAFILLIASFNVISTLSMLMLEKAPDMATLRALGARQSMVRAIFVWEGWLISVLGGLAGIVIGVLLCLAQQTFGLIKLNGDASQLSVTVYPVRVAPMDLLAVFALIILTSLLISLVTARFAPKK